MTPLHSHSSTHLELTTIWD